MKKIFIGFSILLVVSEFLVYILYAQVQVPEQGIGMALGYALAFMGVPVLILGLLIVTIVTKKSFEAIKHQEDSGNSQEKNLWYKIFIILSAITLLFIFPLRFFLPSSLPKQFYGILLIFISILNFLSALMYDSKFKGHRGQVIVSIILSLILSYLGIIVMLGGLR